MDNFNPELASSAIAILKVCIHDVTISRRKTEESLGMKRSDSGRRPLSLEILISIKTALARGTGIGIRIKLFPFPCAYAHACA